MLPETVVSGLKKVVLETIESTRHRFPKRDAWRSLDDDGIWKHIVYQVSVVGSSSSYERLVQSPQAQDGLRYDRLRAGSPESARQIHKILRDHGVRYASADILKCPKTKALGRNLGFLNRFSGGPTAYAKLLSTLPEEERISRVIRDLSYIKQKGARDLLAELGLATNIIALDSRILGILRSLGANVPQSTPTDPSEYGEIQSELLERVCKPLGITGVELDRVLYWNYERACRA